jgi:acyl-CoA reductase-like NAD-dependent aldehyde dehydrogenase
MHADGGVSSVRNPRTGGTDFTFGHWPTIAQRPSAFAESKVAARPLAERIGVMRRWVAELLAHARVIGAADGADTGGCHTSQFTAYIAVANVNGWCEDAEAVLARAHVSGPSITMPSVQIRSQLVPHSLVGVISPWNAPMMLSLLDAVPALFAGSAVLLKPSEITPRFVPPAAHRAQGAGARRSVRRCARRRRTGQDVIAQADLICFTGSVPTGRRLRWPARNG